MHRLLKSFPYNSPDNPFCQVGKAMFFDRKNARISRGIYKISPPRGAAAAMVQKCISNGEKCCCFFVKVRV